VFENKRKYYLGLSETVGIDADFFDYKGVPTTNNPDIWTGLTNGFHMDIDATGVTIDNVFVVINSSGVLIVLCSCLMLVLLSLELKLG
jgi:hypothetical protein